MRLYKIDNLVYTFIRNRVDIIRVSPKVDNVLRDAWVPHFATMAAAIEERHEQKQER